MAIKREYKNVREDVLDEQGNKVGEICFNPEDVGVYDRFLNILSKISESQKKIDGIGDIKELTEEEVTLAEETGELDETFSKIKNISKITVDLVDEISAELDNIFGEGTAEFFLQWSKDLELINPLLDGVMPYFEKARSEKTDKYLNKTDGDVMM